MLCGHLVGEADDADVGVRRLCPRSVAGAVRAGFTRGVEGGDALGGKPPERERVALGEVVVGVLDPPAVPQPFLRRLCPVLGDLVQDGVEPAVLLGELGVPLAAPSGEGAVGPQSVDSVRDELRKR